MSDEMLNTWWIAQPVQQTSTYRLVQYGQRRDNLDIVALRWVEETRLLEDENMKKELERVISSKQSKRDDGMVFFTSPEEELIDGVLVRPKNYDHVQRR